MDSLGFTCIHLDSLGLTWIHLDSLGLTWIHFDSLGFTWTHLHFTWTHWDHLNSLGFTRTHWELTLTHLDSLGLTCIHLDSLRSHQEKGKSSETKPGQKRKGKSSAYDFTEISPGLPHRAYARTNETKRFPGWTHPPTSD